MARNDSKEHRAAGRAGVRGGGGLVVRGEYPHITDFAGVADHEVFPVKAADRLAVRVAHRDVD